MGSLFGMIFANKQETVRRSNEVKNQFFSFIHSQWILFESRRKWAVLYSTATIAGLLCVPGVLFSIMWEVNPFAIIHNILPLPLISFLIAIGMYIFNDLVDVDLDRANGKNRPLASNEVSKKQAWFFIISTNGAAVLLSVVVFDPMRVIIIIFMIVIGIMYSIPKVALMNKFLLKTLSITAFYMLCALLGIISSYGIIRHSANMVMPIHAMVMLGIIAFISSTLNDCGDVEGDKIAGRRTFPVVLGGNNAIKLIVSLALCMLATPWIVFGISIGSGLIAAISENVFALFIICISAKMKKMSANTDADLMRKQHKKLFPLHLVLQSILAVNGVVFALFYMA